MRNTINICFSNLSTEQKGSASRHRLIHSVSSHYQKRETDKETKGINIGIMEKQQTSVPERVCLEPTAITMTMTITITWSPIGSTANLPVPVRGGSCP